MSILGLVVAFWIVFWVVMSLDIRPGPKRSDTEHRVELYKRAERARKRRE